MRLFKEPAKDVPILFLLITLVLLGLIESAWGTTSTWQQRAREGYFNDERYTVEEIDKGIEWLVENANVKARRDPDYRRLLATSFVANGNRFEIPQVLLIAIGYRESVFRVAEIGDHGTALGIMQVRTMGRRRCKKKCGPFSDNPDVQICYGSCWLNENASHCKTLQRGLTGYVSGKCVRDAKRTKRALKIRYNLWEKLHHLVRSP